MPDQQPAPPRPPRGLWGHIWLWAFIAFNAVMVVFYLYARYFRPPPADLRPIQVIGWGVGTAMVALAVLGIWLTGAAILGLLAFLTRGKRPLPPLDDIADP